MKEKNPWRKDWHVAGFKEAVESEPLSASHEQVPRKHRGHRMRPLQKDEWLAVRVGGQLTPMVSCRRCSNPSKPCSRYRYAIPCGSHSYTVVVSYEESGFAAHRSTMQHRAGRSPRLSCRTVGELGSTHELDAGLRFAIVQEAQVVGAVVVH
jgi:hypothetical protein